VDSEAVSPFERVVALLSNVRRLPTGGVMAKCPAHDDTTASLKIDKGDGGRAILYDHGHCETEAVVAAIGLTMADLFPNGNGRPRAVPTKIVAVFDYRDERGELVYQVVRLNPKSFRQRRSDGRGGWIYKLNGVSLLIYRLPELMAASADDWVFIPEGEKHVDTIRALGLVATCNSGGAGKFKPQFAKYLKGRNVAILPDNDGPGRGHAQIVAANVAPAAAQVKIVELPGLAPKGDIIDWLKAGGTREQLLELLATAPVYEAKTALPIIVEDDGQHQEVATQAFKALRRRNDPVRIVGFAGGLSRVECMEDGQHRVIALDVHRLRDELTKAAIWVDLRLRPCVPSVDFGKLLLANESPPLPEVTRFARGPVYTSDGRLLALSGYDAKSKIFILPHSFKLGDVPMKPTTEDLMEAINLLLEVIQDFPFASAADKANAIGLGFERPVREMIAGPLPLHLIEASVPGAGKGLLGKALLAMTNTPAAIWPEVKDEAEMRKALTTFFVAGHEVLFMDNIKRPMKSGVLSAALTADDWTDRLLGVNRDVVVRIRNSWIATANNPSLDKDILRRCDRIRLIPRTEHPENRAASGFKHADLLVWIAEKRNELLRALIILVQHWLAQGKPLPQRVRPLGSFEGWSMTIGGILECAGIEGFQGNRRNYDAADSETEPWRELIAQWWGKYEGALVQSKDLF
jgi:putative DNA primase/helicase